MVTGKIALSGIYENILGPGKRLIIWLQGCDRGCTGCQSTHFARFLPFEDIQSEIDSLNIQKQPAYKYILRCTKCGQEIKRQRTSKVILYYKRYRCGKCGGKLERVL